MNDDIPSEEEIRQLPRWAQVAFAARCARRVQPLFLHSWPDAPKEYVTAIEHAISVAEHAAAYAARAAYATAKVAYAASKRAAAKAAYVPGAGAEAGACAAAFAVSAANTASAANNNRATRTAHAIRAAADSTAAFDAHIAHAATIRADFDLLLRRSSEEHWTNDTPVPATVFGPMWPDGKPPWEQQSDQPVVATARPNEDVARRFKLILQAEVEEGTPPEEVRQKMVSLYQSLNDYSLAKYGKGLTVDEFKRYLAVGAEVCQ